MSYQPFQYKVIKVATIISIILFLSIVIYNNNYDITTIYSLTEIPFSTIQSGAIVAIDVDETLIQPTDPLIYVNSYKAQLITTIKQFILKKYPHVTPDEWDEYASIALLSTDMPLIEPIIIDNIKDLQSRGVSVIACTAMNTGKRGHIQSMEQWRYKHLKKLGFIGSYNDHIISFSGQFQRNPIFYKGMFAVDLEKKGPALGALIDTLNLSPTALIMIDDNYSFIESVQQECKQRNIPFHGYWYHGAHHVNPQSWNWAFIIQQIDHLITQKVYLPPRTVKK